MTKRGRPSKFTTKTKRRLFKAIRLGASKQIACKYADISYETLRTWERRGEEEEGDFSAFLATLKRAEGESVVIALKQIREASTTKWQAAAWILERRYPQDYGKNREPEPKRLFYPTIVEGGSFTDPWLVTDDDDDDDECLKCNQLQEELQDIKNIAIEFLELEEEEEKEEEAL